MVRPVGLTWEGLVQEVEGKSEHGEEDEDGGVAQLPQVHSTPSKVGERERERERERGREGGGGVRISCSS